MRLIDADALYAELVKSNDFGELSAKKAIRRVAQAPTVDALPVIRCKDCKHWMTEDGTFPDFDGKEWHRCKKLRTFIDEDGDTPMTLEWHYCRMAERKEE